MTGIERSTLKAIVSDLVWRHTDNLENGTLPSKIVISVPAYIKHQGLVKQFRYVCVAIDQIIGYKPIGLRLDIIDPDADNVIADCRIFDFHNI